MFFSIAERTVLSVPRPPLRTRRHIGTATASIEWEHILISSREILKEEQCKNCQYGYIFLFFCRINLIYRFGPAGYLFKVSIVLNHIYPLWHNQILSSNRYKRQHRRETGMLGIDLAMQWFPSVVFLLFGLPMFLSMCDMDVVNTCMVHQRWH